MRKALIIAGPSCVGKTTVANELLRINPKLELVRSATTRAPRGDINDGEYIYLSREEFYCSLSECEMLEYMEYGENLYGTPKSELDRIFSKEKIPLLILDINGVKSVRAGDFGFQPIIIYLYSDIATIERRLYDRYLSASDSVENLSTFVKRRQANINDYRSIAEIYHLFDAFVKNDSIDESASEILRIYNELSIADHSADPSQNEKIARELSAQCGQL